MVLRMWSRYNPRTGEQTGAVALNALASIRPPIDVGKIDVQGAEEAVIAGMTNLLARSPGARITLEYWLFGLRELGHTNEQRSATIDPLGYRPRIQRNRDPRRIVQKYEGLTLC
jgi:hypothetical protein